MLTRSSLLTAALLTILSACEAPLREPEPSADWTLLFDGRTLAGWTEVGGRYDGHARWTVEDGVITGREGPERQGGLLYTERAYTDFEFECEVKIEWPFDSGIFLRMAPPPAGKGAQVTIDYRPGGEIAAIYADGYLLHNEQVVERFKKDQWNHFRVRCAGADMHIETWLNGELVVDYRLPPASEGYSPSGLIGIQVHGDSTSPPGTKVQFRALRVKPIAE
jgi:hypothetical protein